MFQQSRGFTADQCMISASLQVRGLLFRLCRSWTDGSVCEEAKTPILISEQKVSFHGACFDL